MEICLTGRHKSPVNQISQDKAGRNTEGSGQVRPAVKGQTVQLVDLGDALNCQLYHGDLLQVFLCNMRTVHFRVEGFFKKSEYDFQKYSDEEYIAVCSPDYRFGKNPDCIENLFQERLLLREQGSGTREVLERYLDAKNLTVQDFARVTEAGSLQTIKELTKAGCGITFLYEAAVRRELEDGSLRQIPLRDFPVVHEFAFIWRRGSIYAEWYRELFRRFSA